MDRPIQQAPTAIAAFVDVFRVALPEPLGGPLADPLGDQATTPLLLSAWSEYTATFGGIDPACAASLAIASFFENGGEQCWCVPATSTDPDALLAALDALDAIEIPLEPRPALLAIPALAAAEAAQARSAIATALSFCAERAMFFVVDPPRTVSTVDAIEDWLGGDSLFAAVASAGALYFPRLTLPDPSAATSRLDLGPSGAVLGVFARSDAMRGVWRAPTGIEATIFGAEPTITLDDAANRRLTSIGVNAIRTFPSHGTVIWGARTLAGADPLASEWKYLPVRRFANSIETSIRRDLALLSPAPESPPAAETLLHSVRRRIESFLLDFFRRGAFAGQTPHASFAVRVSASRDVEATDLERDPIDVQIGFAPLRPAEFVWLNICQILVRNGHLDDPDPD